MNACNKTGAGNLAAVLQPESTVTNGANVAGLSTNGYLYLYNPGPGSWEECRTDVWNHAVSPAPDLWTRVTGWS